MASSNIQTIFRLIKISLACLGINVFVEFQNLNLFSKIYRIFTAVILVFFYSFTFFYTFFFNLQNNDEDKLNDQFLISNCIIGVSTILIRLSLSFIKKNHYFAIFDWIMDVYEPIKDLNLQKYAGTKFEKLGDRYVKIWKWVWYDFYKELFYKNLFF